MLYVLGIVVVVIGIALSIGLHEIGHLVPAKLFGVKVAQYMIGFGPTLFSRKKGETEYGIKAIPLGGYISMAGMYPPARKGEPSRTSGTDASFLEEEYEAGGRTSSTGFFQTLVQDARTASADTITAGDEDRVFYKLPIYKRVIIMLGGPFMNLVIAVVVFAVVLSGFGIPQPTTTVASVSQCVKPATSTSTSLTCSPGDAVAPAAAAGIKRGDRVVSVDGIAVSTWAEETATIQKRAGKTVVIIVDRDGKREELTATLATSPRYKVDANGTSVLDATGKQVVEELGFLGVGPRAANVTQPVTAAIPYVGANIAADFKVIVTLPQRLVGVAQAAFGSGPRDPNGPIGMVGVGRLAGEAASLQSVPFADRFAQLLAIIGSLNVALFAFNLIPLLPLDGGHVAGALWEGLRRTVAKIFKRKDPGPVDIAKLVPLTFVVVLALGVMSLLLVYADIVKPITLQ